MSEDAARKDTVNGATHARKPAPERLETARLILRRWKPDDLAPFAAINADPQVVEHLGGRPLSRAQSDGLVDRIEENWADRGYGLYAVELAKTGALIGFCGLNVHRAVPDQVEIGWRLARSAWGGGLATEAATTVRDAAFDLLDLTALVSVTIRENVRSIRVMEKLGFTFWREQPFEQFQLRIYRLERPSADTPVPDRPESR